MSDGEGRSLTQWFVVAMGIGGLVFAFWLYRYIGQMEAVGGSMRIHWLAALAYKAGGKLAVSGLLALFSLGFIWLGWTGWEPEE